MHSILFPSIKTERLHSPAPSPCRKHRARRQSIRLAGIFTSRRSTRRSEKPYTHSGTLSILLRALLLPWILRLSFFPHSLQAPSRFIPPADTSICLTRTAAQSPSTISTHPPEKSHRRTLPSRHALTHCRLASRPMERTPILLVVRTAATAVSPAL